MRRWICLAMCLGCALGIWYADRLWSGLAGQSLFRLSLVPDVAARAALRQTASETDSELGAFAMREAQLGDADILLYECLAYHPEALGIVMLSGSPITQEQIARGEPVAMLSESAAMRRSPSLDLLDSEVKLEGKTYRVAGVYRNYEPLGLLTRAASASAIVPMTSSGDVRRTFVWLRFAKASPFAFEQAKTQLMELAKPADAGAFQSLNLDSASRMNRQGVRFLALLAQSFVCWWILCAMAPARRRFRERARDAFSRYYGVRACVRLIWPFARSVLPSLSVAASWLVYLAFCANRLIISAARVPVALLDPEAWLRKLESATIAGNLAEQLPMFGCLLNAHLQWICPMLGLIGLCMLWLGARPITKKAGD